MPLDNGACLTFDTYVLTWFSIGPSPTVLASAFPFAAAIVS